MFLRDIALIALAMCGATTILLILTAYAVTRSLIGLSLELEKVWEDSIERLTFDRCLGWN